MDKQATEFFGELLKEVGLDGADLKKLQSVYTYSGVLKIIQILLKDETDRDSIRLCAKIRDWLKGRNSNTFPIYDQDLNEGSR